MIPGERFGRQLRCGGDGPGGWGHGVSGSEAGARAVCGAWAERGVRRQAGGGRPAAWAVRMWAKRELARAALAGRAGVASWAQERSGGLRVWVVGLGWGFGFSGLVFLFKF